MTKEKKKLFQGKLIQYALVGAALGLYYGIFYKPGGDPDIGMAFILSAMAALMTVLVRSVGKGFPFKKVVLDFLKIFGVFLLFMLSLTLRKPAFDVGGQTLVIIETTLTGIVMGLLLAWQRFTIPGVK